MKKITLLLLMLFLGLHCCSPQKQNLRIDSPPSSQPIDSRNTTSSQNPNWELAWADEFDVPGAPNPTRWTPRIGYKQGEWQYYTDRPKNVRVENGKLIIEACLESSPLPSHPVHRRNIANITSGLLSTLDKINLEPGVRVEVRAKLPTGRGTWPAFWLLGINIAEVGWPFCGEIDIMENVGFNPDVIHANIHTEKFNHVKKTNKGAKITIENPEGFHLYAIEWFEDRIDFFLDDQKYFSYKKISDDPAVWPFDKPQYLILNLAIGGAWGGQKGVDLSIFPQRMEVDYVRVYKCSSGQTSQTPTLETNH